MDEGRRRQGSFPVPRHDARAGGQADGRGFHGRPFPVDGQAHGEQIAREAVQDVPVGAVDDGEVLLAAHASHHLDAGREARLQIASEPGYDRVAHRIAVRVVERPEIVDIDDDEAERTTLLREAYDPAAPSARHSRLPRPRSARIRRIQRTSDDSRALSFIFAPQPVGAQRFPPYHTTLESEPLALSETIPLRDANASKT